MFEYLIGQRLKFSPGNQTGPKAFLETLVSRNIRSKRHSINVAKLHIKSLGLGTLNPQPEDRTDPYPIRTNLRSIRVSAFGFGSQPVLVRISGSGSVSDPHYPKRPINPQ